MSDEGVDQNEGVKDGEGVKEGADVKEGEDVQEKRPSEGGTRSGGILPPGAGLGWSGTYFSCPVPGCPTKERARPDGSLGSGRCGEHGKVLARTSPAARRDAGAEGGQAS